VERRPPDGNVDGKAITIYGGFREGAEKSHMHVLGEEKSKHASIHGIYPHALLKLMGGNGRQTR